MTITPICKPSLNYGHRVGAHSCIGFVCMLWHCNFPSLKLGPNLVQHDNAPVHKVRSF